LKSGVPFDQIEERIDDASKLLQLLALALFGDAALAGQVMSHLNHKFGHSSVDCVKALNQGAHELIDRDPQSIIKDSEELAHAIAKEG
jgi:hypothetical protein